MIYVWKLTYKWADLQPPEQVEALGRQPVLRHVQPLQARQMGVRRPRKRRLPAQVRLDAGSSDTSWSRARPPRTTPPWPSTGPNGDARRHPRRSARPDGGLYKTQDGRCPICGDWLQPAEDPPPTPREWERWLATTRKTIIRSPCTRTARRRRTNPVSYTPTATIGTPPGMADQHFCPPASPRGLLEPDAAKRRTSGSEGGRAQQCVRPTRRGANTSLCHAPGAVHPVAGGTCWPCGIFRLGLLASSPSQPTGYILSVMSDGTMFWLQHRLLPAWPAPRRAHRARPPTGRRCSS